MVKISVIYYVFNNQIFLKDSLDSILTQTFEDIEIRCIDNGSTDDSLNILSEYKEKDNRLIINSINHIDKTEAINNELKNVNGKYVYITTPGCKLNFDALELLYEKAENNSSELTVSDMGYLNEINDSYYEKKCFLDTYDEVVDYKKIPNLIDVDTSLENKLFLLSFIKKNNLKLEYGNEKSFVYEAIFKAKNISYNTFVLFVYDEYYASLANKDDVSQLYIVEYSNKLLEFFDKYGVLDDYQNRLYDHKMYITLNVLNKIREEYKETFYNKVRQDLKEILLNDELCEDFLNNISGYFRKVFESIIISESYYEYELLKKTYYEMNDYYNLLIDRNYFKQAQNKKIKEKPME